VRYVLTTLGCKVNQYDGAAVGQALERLGWQPTAEPDQADLVIVNTCCVTATAMAKSRQAIRRIVGQAANPAVLVIGCYSDYDGQCVKDILASLGVPDSRSAILGHHEDVRNGIENLSNKLFGQMLSPHSPIGPADDERTPATIRTRRHRALAGEHGGRKPLGPIERFPGHQRAFVKVQDGCDAFCTYCVVPLTRPRLSWRPADEVAEECQVLIDNGHMEIVLCGVFLGAYGLETSVRAREDAPAALPDLVSRIAALPGLWRVRLSSLEPADLTDELLAIFQASPTAAPHFHLPLQSGSSQILKRMNRQYTAGDFARTVDRLRATLDRPAVTTDVIVGFPGESDADFAATLDVLRSAGVAKIHAFPFSPVEGTAAYAWRNECPPPAIVKDRVGRLTELERDLAEAYRRQFVGETMEGLVESARPGKPRQAMTDRYLSVAFDAPDADDLTGQVVWLSIDGTCGDGLTGTFAGQVPGFARPTARA